MKPYVLFLLLTFIAFASRAQSCSCTQEYDFTVQYVERNLPGFTDNVTPQNRSSYEAFKKQLRREATHASSKTACLKYLVAYVEYFRDNHTDISAQNNNIDEKDPEAVRQFLVSPDFLATETLRLDTTRRARAKADPLEGYYQTPDGAYRVYLTRSKTRFRSYAAVIVATQTTLWRPGQVKFELRPETDSTYQPYQYQRNHSLFYQPRVRYAQGRLVGTSWQRVGTGAPAASPAAPSPKAGFQMLTGEVAYLRIPTFSGQQFALLDSLYRAIEPQIRKARYLVIDVRNNGGGSDRNVAPLLPFLYTQPIRETQIEEFYNTPDNIRRYKEYLRQMQKDSAQFGAGALRSYRQIIRLMQAAPPNSFLPNPSTTDTTYVFPAAPRPAKVAILYNQGCASSCETLLIWAKQSAKTILVGENSGGYLAYGNLLPVTTPCYTFTLDMTTTRYKNQLPYEAVGVAPDYRLRPAQDWLTQTLHLLTQ